jgi:hypothetical protein
MSFFLHTPDDKIIIDDGVLDPQVWPLAFFVTQEALYALASPYTSQYYEPTVKHVLTTGTTSYNNSIPWLTGDGYISNLATYQAAYLDYRYPPTLAKAKSAHKIAVEVYATTYFVGGVTYGGTNYQSIQRPINELHQYGRYGELPATHYVLDEDDNQVAVTFQQLLSICNLIEELWFEVNKNIDAHKAAIDALGSIANVLAYDYTTGWPTIPYV